MLGGRAAQQMLQPEWAASAQNQGPVHLRESSFFYMAHPGGSRGCGLESAIPQLSKGFLF